MYDLVILNGKVFDGNDGVSKKLNIGITDDKIAVITELPVTGKKIIDASNKYVSPGFIDVHGHSDLVPLLGANYNSKLYQGVTTEINGNCGIGPVPSSPKTAELTKKYMNDNLSISDKKFDFENINSLNKLKKLMKSHPFNINQGYLIGGGSIRIAVMGFDNREASQEEIEKMQLLLEDELKAGAYGISFGLIYPPGSFTYTKEIIEMLKVIKKYDKVAVFHMRNEGEKVLESVEEMIFIAKESGAKVEISHFKIMYKPLWDTSEKLIKMIEEAREKGVKISFDQYPYVASATSLFVLIPSDLFAVGLKAMIEKLDINDKALLDQIKDKIEKRGGADRVVIASVIEKFKESEGKNLLEISKIWNISPEQCVVKFIKESTGKVNAIYFSMSESDVENIMKQKYGIIASDGYSYPLETPEGFGFPHPRNFGTFPKFLETVREKNLLSIEEALRKITSIPAKVFNIKDRGVLKEGAFADITIFDFEKIKDNSTFINPFRKPSGIDYVIVNGKVTVENGIYNHITNGKII
ncbi:putative D-aminoacylase [Fusobacterium varium]|nr:putative D-aminoacylase [Fusobacterium varium]